MLTPEEKASRKKANQEKNKRNLRKSLLIVALIILAPVVIKMVWGPIGINFSYSEGERKVRIIKVASKGFIWKTWEIEGVITQDKGFSTTYIWDFSIDADDAYKDELMKTVNSAFESGTLVKVKYDQRAGSVPWRSETTYWAKEITAVP